LAFVWRLRSISGGTFHGDVWLPADDLSALGLARHLYPDIDLLSHNSGHLLQTLLGWKGDPHLSPLHWLSDLLIGGGFILIAAAWDVLYRAQCTRQLATAGPYAYLRHPQYVGFVVIMLGFLIQWPTLIMLIMFPILVTMYIRLARREEREALVEFGEAYAHYAARTPAFFPRRPQAAAGGVL
jgi:hypothetical protein